MIVFLIAFCASALIVRLVIHLAILDHPVDRSSHTHPTPRGGGIAFVIVCCAYTLFGLQDLPSFLISMGAICLAITHFIDDVKGLAYRWRFLAQFVCAFSIVASGMHVHLAGDETTFFLRASEALLSFSGLVFILNATNFSDGLNGLLSGTTLIAGFFYLALAAVSIPEPQFIPILNMGFVFLGAVFGFFIFNFPQARIFMGDVGSTFIGFIFAIAALVIQPHFQGQTALGFFNRGFVLALFPFGFIWFDIAFTLLRRLWLRRPLTEAHREHLFQLLHRCGYRHATVTSLYMALTVLLGASSLATQILGANFTYLFILYGCLQISFIVWVFRQAHHHRLVI